MRFRFGLTLFLLAAMGFVSVSGAFAASTDAITVFYFHGAQRCPHCTAVEQNAKDALQEKYPDMFASGMMEWKDVDLSKPENRHFIKEFNISKQTLAFARSEAGGKTTWTDAPDIWKLDRDVPALKEYVVETMQTFLKKTN